MQIKSIIWAAFAVLLPFASASAQAINPVTLQKVALAGERIMIWGATALNPDCSVMGPTTVKIRKEPRHGKLEIEEESGFPHYAKDSLRSQCNTRQVPMKKIYYTAGENFAGSDQMELEGFFSSGHSRKVVVNVTVKK
jgi:hypothetical protein